MSLAKKGEQLIASMISSGDQVKAHAIDWMKSDNGKEAFEFFQKNFGEDDFDLMHRFAMIGFGEVMKEFGDWFVENLRKEGR